MAHYCDCIRVYDCQTMQLAWLVDYQFGMEPKKWIRMYDVASEYQVKDRVGRGTYGTVFKAKGLSDKKNYAIKKLENNDPKLQSEGFPITALRQIILLKEMDHPNVIRLKEIILSKPSARNMNRGSTFLVFEYMDHDLAGIFRNKVKFSLPEIKCITKQLLEGVGYLHAQKLFHRDIKSANILLNDKGDIKLADFGLGRKSKPDGLYTYKVVTLWYRAPELILGCKKYDYKVDVWSLGCVLAEFFTGQVLFKKQSDYAQLEKILEVMGDYDANNVPSEVTKSFSLYNQAMPNKRYENMFRSHLLSLNPDINNDALQLLSGLLNLDPNKRLTCEEALRSPFFTNQPVACQRGEIKKFEYEYHELFKDNIIKIDREQKKNRNPTHHERRLRSYSPDSSRNESKDSRKNKPSSSSSSESDSSSSSRHRSRNKYQRKRSSESLRRGYKDDRKYAYGHREREHRRSPERRYKETRSRNERRDDYVSYSRERKAYKHKNRKQSQSSQSRRREHHYKDRYREERQERRRETERGHRDRHSKNDYTESRESYDRRYDRERDYKRYGKYHKHETSERYEKYGSREPKNKDYEPLLKKEPNEKSIDIEYSSKGEKRDRKMQIRSPKFDRTEKYQADYHKKRYTHDKQRHKEASRSREKYHKYEPRNRDKRERSRSSRRSRENQYYRSKKAAKPYEHKKLEEGEYDH